MPNKSNLAFLKVV